jgi:hypothetical protein
MQSMRSYLILIPWLLLPAAAGAQRVHGRVVDASTDRGIPNVEVRLENAGGPVARVVTDSTGRFVLRSTTGAGKYRLTTNHIAYAAAQGEVELGADEQAEVVLRLSTAATELAPLVIVARSRAPDAALERVGFYERKAGRFGVFLDRDEVERKRPFYTTDLFRGMSGVRVINAGIRGNDIRITRAEDPNCPPRVFIDNVIVRRGGRASRADDPPLDMLIQPGDIQAVEVFRSATEIPTQYVANDVVCGVVLFWTKRGSRQ